MATVFVIGAGPAGMFAAQKLALAGHEVVIFNRDVKPGGLAEYGIYPVKDKMKNGLRKQFAKVLALPNVHYFGHVPVGAGSPVSIATLLEFRPAAMVFAVGAQGNKKLGMAGEDATGVYSAKDFVYHYNQLPPFASRDFSIGKRVAIIGMGNVMVDIARWLLLDAPNRTAEEVIVIARRGPLEAKFDEKEFAYVHPFLDREMFATELQRVKACIEAVGQDIAKVPEETFRCLAKFPAPQTTLPRLTFRFLSSPTAISAGPDGRIARLTVADNLLVSRDGNLSATAAGTTTELEVDTLIFAIGDMHDPALGLPFGPQGYVTNPDPNFPRAAYEVFDHTIGKIQNGVFVAGWARKPSEGLVGIARRDGEVGAAHVLEYLQDASAPDSASAASAADVGQSLKQKGIQIVPKSDLEWLSKAEEQECRLRANPYCRFPDDAAMLAAIEQAKSSSAEDVALTAQ
jgi:ferredoxin/flavodoxin---NADP+ reductase